MLSDVQANRCDLHLLNLCWLICNCCIGICKIEQTCCAFISAIQDVNDNAIRVDYCKHHVGHSLDIGHLRLSSELRLEIAALLHQGVTVSKVMDTVRQRVSSSVERDNLLCRLITYFIRCFDA